MTESFLYSFGIYSEIIMQVLAGCAFVGFVGMSILIIAGKLKTNNSKAFLVFGNILFLGIVGMIILGFLYGVLLLWDGLFLKRQVNSNWEGTLIFFSFMGLMIFGMSSDGNAGNGSNKVVYEYVAPPSV